MHVLCRALALSLFFSVLVIPAFAAPVPKEGILLVAFGTSVPEARSAFTAIEKLYKQEFPDTPIVWAFTSQCIRKKLARDGVHIGGIGAGLAKLALAGAQVVRVQSLHMMAGKEFAGLARSVLLNIQKHPGRFKAVYLCRPLLESEKDAEEAADAVMAYLDGKRQQDEAIVLMGHGQEHGLADLTFAGATNIFKSRDPHIFMATVEGSRNFEQLAAELKKTGVKKVLLAPLMLVAGDHARNDLAGTDSASWASRLGKAGIEARSCLLGLGEVPGIAAIFARHTRQNEDDLVKEPLKE